MILFSCIFIKKKLCHRGGPCGQRAQSYIRMYDVISYQFLFKINPLKSISHRMNSWPSIGKQDLFRSLTDQTKKSEWGVFQKAYVGRKGQYLNWNSMMNCCPLLSTAVSEQWASPGPQGREEGAEGQSDPGGPPGVVLQHLATLFHHQHGTGRRSNLNMKIKRSAESVRLVALCIFPPFLFLCSVMSVTHFASGFLYMFLRNGC